MKSINIVPRDRKEFDAAFTLLTKFGEDRKLLSLEDDEDISFVFLIRHKEDTELVPIGGTEKNRVNKK